MIDTECRLFDRPKPDQVGPKGEWRDGDVWVWNLRDKANALWQQSTPGKRTTALGCGQVRCYVLQGERAEVKIKTPRSNHFLTGLLAAKPDKYALQQEREAEAVPVRSQEGQVVDRA